MLAPQGPHDLHAPISRTQRYKKITKPLLERQRRARINRCLDELKELVVSALQTEGENVSKLEKADILELTVRHLHRLQQDAPAEEPVEGRFEAGFSQCASEACHFLLSLPGLDPQVSRRIVDHLGQCADGLRQPVAQQPEQQQMWRPW
ncbi:enhancer of split mgamma protein-like [Neocloeon triangulifer]|uniref:enhancer of split mgamma protein-like n=1 Tax=Neocloeon triangulifer TaxID=2078957 RepID=UPI00286F0054|nr:enhancer of split mgamma protein-like [Neocloeon triangulifer]